MNSEAMRRSLMGAGPECRCLTTTQQARASLEGVELALCPEHDADTIAAQKAEAERVRLDARRDALRIVADNHRIAEAERAAADAPDPPSTGDPMADALYNAVGAVFPLNATAEQFAERVGADSAIAPSDHDHQPLDAA